MKNGMVLTAREATMVLGVLSELQYRKDVRAWIGSLTLDEISSLVHKMEFNDYCIEYGKNIEDLTEDDYLRHYEDKYYVYEWEVEEA